MIQKTEFGFTGSQTDLPASVKVAISLEAVAGTLYEVYCAAVGGKAFNGDPLPKWAEFRTDPAKRKQSDAWVLVAKVSEQCHRSEFVAAVMASAPENNLEDA